MAKRIDYAELLRLRSAGLTASQIAERLGCSADSVHKATGKFGLEKRTSGKRPRLSATEIHRLWVEGVPTQEIADKCGLSIGTIYSYAQRMKLPKRPKAEKPRDTNDPAPDEIERLKAELFERHMEKRRAEAPCNTHSKVSKWRHNICQPRGIA